MPDKLFVGRNYINGKWMDASNDLEVYDPATNNVIGHIPLTGKEFFSQIDWAVETAHKAFGIWGDNTVWSWVKRAEVIDDLVQLVKSRSGEIANIVALESGKHISEARADVVEGIHMLQYCAGMGRHPNGYKICSEIAEKEIETYLDPRGVCTVITPWNFPFAIPTWLIGPALVSGNTVVFKPSEETPFSGQFIVELFDEVAKKHNIPPGVFNLIHGAGDVGEALVEHPLTVVQLFTGSCEVGQKIKRIAASHTDKLAICEMGGKNSLIILDDADMELALNAAILSAYKTTHQRCVSADLIIVDERIEKEFTEKFLKLTNRIRFGSQFDETVLAGPLINREAINKFDSHGEIVARECDEILCHNKAEVISKGNFVRPNIFRMRYRPGTVALRKEAFTPNIVIVPVVGLEEAITVANDNDGCLSQALITNDYRLMRKFKVQSRSGLKYINLPTIGAEVHVPFGGVKNSGTGMPSAAWLFKHLCHETALTINYGREIKLAQGLSAEIY